ncbi:GntR family transcriptional regulator [Streptomyces coelicoflavus]
MKLPLGEDPRPPYVQAADVLRAAIHDGELRPGERLPAARDCACSGRTASAAASRSSGSTETRGVMAWP